MTNVHHGLNGPNAVRLVAMELIFVRESAQILREKVVLKLISRMSLVQIFLVVNVVLYKPIP